MFVIATVSPEWLQLEQLAAALLAVRAGVASESPSRLTSADKRAVRVGESGRGGVLGW
jgi:hypothetical protein